ncbi:NAD(P)-binding protein [Mycolicibacterium llatzerense]|uniref:NAD(P)-binding protein n=1 Tax=Mycolicibacterium llatzerense TaxID=280871 RepID=UPI0013A68F99|nr:NAD(P)-binding protein [Mycolicibacterium llatzerense]
MTELLGNKGVGGWSGASDGRGRVAIFGGGPGGLSAALELAERGFEVDLYERAAYLGGKARSEVLEGTGTGPRKDLPIENGPHAYWGTYQHWNDTLSRVPSGVGGSVLDNLVPAGEVVRLAWRGTGGWASRARFFFEFARALRSRALMVSELPRVLCKLMALATSGPLRQREQLEFASLLDYTGPLSRKSFELLAAVVAQVKVAPDLVSARETACNLHIFSGYFGAKGLGSGAVSSLAMTRGPADEAIFAPFGRHLEKLGVKTHLSNELVELISAQGAVTGAQMRDRAGVSYTVEADWYVLAVPQDVAPKVLPSELVEIDAGLGRLELLGEQWLGAANVYLKGPAMPLISFSWGPWQVVALDYSAYVPNFGDKYGDGTVKQWFSIDLQTWDYPGLLYGKTAKECTKDEFFDEIIAHLAAANPSSWGKLNRRDIIRWDTSRLLHYEPGQPVVNKEPLFGAVVGAWDGQPEPVTGIDNLFIAATYAKTSGGIDSMDCACEAARVAVNAILDRTGTGGERAFVDTYGPQSGKLKWLWDYDDRRYRKGLANRFDILVPFRG